MTKWWTASEWGRRIEQTHLAKGGTHLQQQIQKHKDHMWWVAPTNLGERLEPCSPYLGREHPWHCRGGGEISPSLPRWCRMAAAVESRRAVSWGLWHPRPRVCLLWRNTSTIWRSGSIGPAALLAASRPGNSLRPVSRRPDEQVGHVRVTGGPVGTKRSQWSALWDR